MDAQCLESSKYNHNIFCGYYNLIYFVDSIVKRFDINVMSVNVIHSDISVFVKMTKKNQYICVVPQQHKFRLEKKKPKKDCSNCRMPFRAYHLLI